MEVASLKFRLLNLLRGRLVISYMGLITIWIRPDTASEVLGVVAVACGVSAVDALAGVTEAYRGKRRGETRQDGDP